MIEVYVHLFICIFFRDPCCLPTAWRLESCAQKNSQARSNERCAVGRERIIYKRFVRFFAACLARRVAQAFRALALAASGVIALAACLAMADRGRAESLAALAPPPRGGPIIAPIA